jgi:hypothetical protein
VAHLRPATLTTGGIIPTFGIAKRIKGETSGRKNRLTAIVLVRTEVGPGEMVYVVPITHSEPANGDGTKILIPQSIKQRLELDEDRSWVDVTEYTCSFGRDMTSNR